MADSRVFIGLIGLGGHTTHHVENFGSNTIIVNSVWDPDPEALDKYPKRLHEDSLDALLSNKHLQAVLIGSPDKFHLTQIEMALAAGKHVFCEKPLSVPGESIARLEATFDLAASKELVLTSCHPRRFDKPIWWLKNEVLMQPTELPTDFGAVVSFSFDFSYHEPSNAWKHTRSLLLDHVNHEIDLMNHLFGIRGFEAWKLHDNFDRYDVTGVRDDGITFHLQGTRRLKSSKYPEWCRVRFERGEVILDMMMGMAYIVDVEKSTTTMVSNLAIDYSGRLKGVMENFHNQIGGAPGYLSRAEMLMNTEAGIVLQNDGIQRINVRT